MSKNNKNGDNGHRAMKKIRTKVPVRLEVIPASRLAQPRCGLLTAFTFVEVIVALTIVSISLLALIRLHIISITMTEAAEITSQAVSLAEEKITEILATGYPKEETNSGTVEKNALTLHWQSEITDLRLTQLEQADITGLRRILVDVRWKQGVRQKHLQMSTYAADRKLP